MAQIYATSLQDDLGEDAGREQDGDADTGMQTPPPQARTPNLLRLIELHPPSPPGTLVRARACDAFDQRPFGHHHDSYRTFDVRRRRSKRRQNYLIVAVGPRLNWVALHKSLIRLH